jgi:hypothetical protein
VATARSGFAGFSRVEEGVGYLACRVTVLASRELGQVESFEDTGGALLDGRHDGDHATKPVCIRARAAVNDELANANTTRSVDHARQGIPAGHRLSTRRR